MKLVLISDTHFGVRNDSQLFIDHFASFYQNVFFPYLEENNINTIIHAGDLFDRRKFVNFNVLSSFRNLFFEELKSRNIEMHLVIGNHDTYFKNTNILNSPEQLLGEYENIKVYKSPQNISLDGRLISVLPWINSENEEESMDFIKNTNSEMLVGHLELDGFEAVRGMKHEGSLKASSFSKFSRVVSGHFHCKQSKKNITYLGSPYQMVFSDAGEERGFWEMDTDDLSMKFIKNPEEIFYSLSYDDENKDYSGFVGKKYAKFKDRYVKIYVTNRKDPNMLDSVIKTIQDSGAYDLSVMEVPEESCDKNTIEDMSRSTIDIIMEEIDKDESIQNKSSIKSLIKEFYMESLTS